MLGSSPDTSSCSEQSPSLPSAIPAQLPFLLPSSALSLLQQVEHKPSTAVCSVLLQWAANFSSPSPSQGFDTAFHTLSSCNTAVFVPSPSEAATPSPGISAAVLLSSPWNRVCAVSEWKLLRSRDACPALLPDPQRDNHQQLLTTRDLLWLWPLYF